MAMCKSFRRAEIVSRLNGLLACRIHDPAAPQFEVRSPVGRVHGIDGGIAWWQPEPAGQRASEEFAPCLMRAAPRGLRRFEELRHCRIAKRQWLPVQSLAAALH